MFPLINYCEFLMFIELICGWELADGEGVPLTV